MWGCKQSQCCLPGMCSWLWFGPCSEPQGPWGKKKETIWLRGKKEAANTRPLSTAAAAASETCHGRTGQFFCVSCSFPTKTCTKALPCVVKEITDTGQEGDSANKLWDGDKVGSQGCLVLKSSPPLSLWVKRTEGKGNAVSKELAGKLFEASRERDFRDCHPHPLGRLAVSQSKALGRLQAWGGEETHADKHLKHVRRLKSGLWCQQKPAQTQNTTNQVGDTVSILRNCSLKSKIYIEIKSIETQGKEPSQNPTP